jgi:dTDP-4-amino-4,6-dideoxygalactose transaminase
VKDYSQTENIIRLTKHTFSDEVLSEVCDVIKSGNLVQGPKVARLESELQEFLGVTGAVLVSSGTAALHLALVALNIGPGDEVIVPAFTYPATANVVELVGARSVIVDISLDDLCIDVSAIESKVTGKTKAIMPVHEFGMPCDLTALMELASKYRIPVIEDAACSFGSEFAGKKAGTFGLMGCFSLHPRKAITTGEGGVVVTNSPELCRALKELRAHGMVPVDGRFDFVRAGFNYRLTEFQAVLGLAQMREFDSFLKRRLEIADILDRELSDVEWFSTPKRFAERMTVYQSYHVLLNESVDRKAVIAMLKERGIESNLGAHALAHLTYFQKTYGVQGSDFPNASRAYTHGLVLPIGPHMDDDDVLYLISTLKSVSV